MIRTKPTVRVVSDEACVLNARVEIRDGDEWHDISNGVRRISWDVGVGDISYVTVDLLPASLDIQGFPSDETLRVMAEHLRAHGWKVADPKDGDVIDVTSMGSKGIATYARPIPAACDAEDRSVKGRTL